MSASNPSKFSANSDEQRPHHKEFEKAPQKEDELGSIEFTKELKVELSVADTGIGIPERDLPSLFKVFGKTRSNHNRNQTGTGLGLTICKKLCEKLGGNIELKSKEGVGTKVTCLFTCLY
uniref:histidine kinase n=1 Tax=Euplotes crassus TaxID=5936 RepID=A0A7S3KX61_EUPCR|mmetsp:Transcript_9441/g.9152  ORF Transcript_9441/g.9152 Transcript_9441/m.9152 type:complete len:120 (+) Transcript_9441:524-883(+)